jgi:tetratricopeptide (TPR) repeat protein
MKVFVDQANNWSRYYAMRLRDWPIRIVALLLILRLSPRVRAQASPDASYRAERQTAAELFEQGKRLEALPLLEQLVKANSRDDEMLVDLAASLVDHAATLVDREASGKERLRARDLLARARDLGNSSSLALNLLQLLLQVTDGGDIRFSDDPQVDAALRAGEAAFGQRDFDDAIKDYGRALELQPENYDAALFLGNAYERKNEAAKARAWYERAIQLDPNVETAYRYYAGMLAREHDMAKARLMLIHAAVAEPYNRIVWRELHAWAALNGTQINFVYVGIPREPRAPGIDARQQNALSAAWDAYYAVLDQWQNGGEFKRRFPEDKQYRHSLPEESEALTAAIKVLEKLEADGKSARRVDSDTGLVLLLKLHEAGLIEPYVLFSLGDPGIARDYTAYRGRNRERLEEYMDKFVVPLPR